MWQRTEATSVHDDSVAVVVGALLSPAQCLRSFAGPIAVSVFDSRDPLTALGDLAGVPARAARGSLTSHAWKAHA